MNPDTTTLQTDTNTNKNYIVFQNVFGEPENVMYADNEFVGALKQFLNTDSIPTTSYPNLVKTDGMAMGFADAEVAGQAVRTENGIMLIACNGLNYMDNVDPSKSWHIMYSINDTDMYKKIMNAMTEGYIIGKDIENVSKWEKYFEEKELSYERILSDEELELLQMNKI